MKISVIIPACNEEASIGKVVADIPVFATEVIVVDNGSTDRTGERAKAAGARVVREPVRGYGKACQTGIAAAGNPDIIVILDGDYSDFPEEMGLLTTPIIDDEADMVLGSRTLGNPEPGALPFQTVWGNRLATFLIRILFGYRYTDMGPFRAIRSSSFNMMDMKDPDFGWNVEMQAKAVTMGVRIREVPVRYRKRIGRSKISGTVSGTVRAGIKIIYSVFKYRTTLR